MDFISVLKASCIRSGKGIIVENEILQMVQNKVLSMFDDVIAVCEENQIPYQLSGGSALGAVRHHGMIPWDDDIDINMCRQDIQRFIPAFRKKFGDKYWVKVLGETEGYNYLMIHILAKDVRARTPMELADQENGLCLDIFPVENTFNNPFLRKFHGLGCMGFRYILSCIRFRNNQQELTEIGQHDPDMMSYIRKRTKIGKFVLIIPERVWCRWCSKWLCLCHDDASEFVSIPSGRKQFFDELYLRKKFCQSSPIKFENRIVNISSDYDGYLKRLYGDYMQIPPLEKQEHHFLIELDTEALQNYRRKS